ncbi:pheromone-regulated protein prm10 [Coemansia sp. RSA 1358]|nr:pheromone-regulated protein prm10 [Coemansia umbellata]KAJ2621980.1 pheromone-regulated protein prm10 [Coemansia sp. RSA 1358]
MGNNRERGCEDSDIAQNCNSDSSLENSSHNTESDNSSETESKRVLINDNNADESTHTECSMQPEVPVDDLQHQQHHILQNLSMHNGSLNRDLSRLAARLQNSQSLPQASPPAKPQQRPLQIHLDIATVEHNVDSYSDARKSDLERPGLLARYLQLADVDQQRERLEQRQQAPTQSPEIKCVDDKLTPEPIYQHLHQHQGQQQPGSVSKCYGNITWHRSEERLGSDLITFPESARARMPLRQRSQSQPRIHNALISDRGVRPIVVSRNSTNKCTTPPAQEQANTATHEHQVQVTLPNLRDPFSDIDLTRFLPYALSTPGIQTAIGSPSLSRSTSLDNIADWVKHREQILDGTAAMPNRPLPDVNNDSLSNRRTRLLDGIHRLLVHQKFICLLAQAMMQYGAPLHHLEDNLLRISRQLYIKATFTTMPGLIIISFEDQATFTSETKVIRCPNGYDMHRLELTDCVFRTVSKEEISVEEGTRQLNKIMSAQPLFAWYWQLLDWGITSWSVCILAFNGSWIDSAAALVLGMIAGCLNLLASKLKGYTNLFEASVSIVCGFLATAVERWVCFGAVTLSATAVLLPGLLLTTGIIELTSRNMHAGTIRVGYALTLAFIIAFGINLGNNIFVEIFSKPDRIPDMSMTTCSPASPWWWWLTFPISISSICLLINVHPRHWPACIIVAGIMFSVFWYLVLHLHLKTVGPVVSAFVLGITANIWSKLFKHNAYATMLPGVMILVPGSVGVRGIMSMFQQSDNSMGTQHLVAQMVQTSLSIMVGLFASSFVIYPRGKKQSALLTI